MARMSFVWDSETQSLIPKSEALAKKYSAYRLKRSSIGMPMLIRDSMDPIKSMLDGEMYDSKSAYYKSIAASHCEIVGYDSNWTDYVAKPQCEAAYEAELVSDVKKSIEQANA